jgi:high affinity sulfate transporter 1
MNASSKQSGVAKFIPIGGWLPRYQPGWLKIDLIAGLTAAAVVIPQALAYASIAGLPVEVGLYTALVPMIAYAFFGTSRPLSVSTTSTIALLTATELQRVVQSSDPYDYIVPAATLAFLVGLILLVAGILRLGFLSNFISDPILTGFKAGIGVVIFVDQLAKVLGLSIEADSIVGTLIEIVQSLDEISWPTAMISAISLAILILLPRFAPKIPAALVTVAVGILISLLIDLEALGVVLIGPIPAGLPSLSLPDVSLFVALLPGALGIALMSFVESSAAGRTFIRREDTVINANQEMIALGFSNIGGGLTQSMPAGGGTSQTAVNDQSGAKSQIAALSTAGVVLITLVFLAPLISYMPEATLGALVLVAAAGLIKFGEFRTIRSYHIYAFSFAVIAFLGVVFIGTLEGILIAALCSMITILYGTSIPNVYALGRKSGTNVFRPLEDHSQDETTPGLLALRIEGFMYFANVGNAINQITALARQYEPRVIVIDVSAVTIFEYTAMKQFRELDGKLQEAGIELWIASFNRRSFKAVEPSSFGQGLGHERMYTSLEQAVEAFNSTVQKNS